MNYYKLTNKESGEVKEGDFETVNEALAAAGLWMAKDTVIEKRVRDGFRVVKPEELANENTRTKSVEEMENEVDKLIEESKQEPPPEPEPSTDTGDGVKPEPEFTAEDYLTEEPVPEEEPTPGSSGYPPESLLPKIKAYSEALVIDSSLYSAIGDEYKVKSIVRKSTKPDDVFEWEYELLRIKDDWTAKHNLWEITELFTLGEEPIEEPTEVVEATGSVSETAESVRKVVGDPTELEAKAIEHKEQIEAYAIQAEVVFLEMGHLLYEARVGAEWSILSYESYKSYIEDLQLPMTNSYSWATRLSNIYEYMIKKMGLDPKFIAQIGVAKATRLLPLARKGMLTQEVLDAALALSDLDLRETLGHNVSGGEDGETEDLVICPRCGENFNSKKAVRVK